MAKIESEDQKPEHIESRIPWHRWLGQLFEALLVPVGVLVHTDHPLMSAPPASDILLMSKDQKGWTDDQKAVLPDGIRDSTANQIMIEFKYTESVNDNVMRQVMCYDYFYKQTQQQKDDEVQTFLITSKTTQKKTLQNYGYESIDQNGVYRSDRWELKHITLLSLNDLSNDPHNAYIKCFASKKKERDAAFRILEQKGLSTLDASLESVLIGLKIILIEKGGLGMQIDLTTMDLKQIGQKFKEEIISRASPEERLKGLDLKQIGQKFKEEIISRASPEERLKGLDLKQIGKKFKEEIISKASPEERLKGLGAEERLKGLKAEDIFKGFKPEEIEAYLQKHRKVKKAKSKG